METQTSKKNKNKGQESGNTEASDLILTQREEAKKDELYLFSCEAQSFENIFVSPTKQNLRTVVVIGQSGITTLNGISRLMNLRELWVVECLVKDLTDLEKCRQLETLYLYSNDIGQVPDMSNSSRLKLLSLSGNNISYLENFHSMPKLKELYIANNRINKIGHAFSHNSYLSLVNLAGNPLYKLKDIKNLSFISSLWSIVFADPLYGDCPFVYLCNYRYFVVNYLSGLTKLDHYSITSEERSCVAEFFKSKLTFYNMLRIKQLNHFTKSFKYHLEENRRRIGEYRKEIYSAQLNKIAASYKVGDGSREFLPDRILQRIYRRIDANEISEQRRVEESKINLQILQRQLCLMVEHCGNMNFVEYMPGNRNTLVRICQDMCNDSLCQTVRQDLGITRIHVHRVTKVINKETDALRSSRFFDNSINQDDIESDSVFKFLVRPVGVVELQKWPFDIFEEEFFDATEVIVSDCLVAADAEWAKRISLKKRSAPSALSSPSQRRLAILIQLPVSTLTTRVEKPDDYHTMHLGYNKDTCRCLSVANPEQVKPVFAVEYEYIFQNGFDKKRTERPSVKLLAPGSTLKSWTSLNFEHLLKCLNLTEVDIHKLQVIDLRGRGVHVIDSTTPLPNLRELYLSYNKLTALPDSVMLQYVTKLDVSFNDIQSLEIATCLPSMQTLNIAWNRAFAFVTMLQMLETITPNLITLNVKYNPFEDVTEEESMFLLARNAIPSLKYFNNNIIENFAHSRPVNLYPWIIEIFEKADAAKFKVTQTYIMASVISETNKSLTSPLSIGENEFKNVEFVNFSDNHLSNVGFLKEFPQLKELYLANNLLMKINIENAVNKVTKLILSSNFIMKIDGLTQENLPLLNYLDLCNNLITSLIAMGAFHSLIEFYCTNNRIGNLSEMYNLKSWQRLKMIDMSNNAIDSTSLCNKFIIFHISKIEYVGGQRVTDSNVTEANHAFGGSLDKDRILNTCTAADLMRIKQLSIVNSSIKKVDLTPDLMPHLESLDLSRNQITTLWGLHNLKKLQVLCLSHNEVNTSLPVHRKDYVPAKCPFPRLNTLHLDHNGIRSLLDCNFQNMPALKYLYLQHNELQDVKGLQKCASLETLVLDQNKIQIITEEDFHTENNIKALFLENNKIKFLSFASRLSKIKKLFISNNKVAVRRSEILSTHFIDKDQLNYIGKLANLKELTILGNPFCKKENHYKIAVQAIATLTRIDGHSVILKEYLNDPQ